MHCRPNFLSLGITRYRLESEEGLYSVATYIAETKGKMRPKHNTMYKRPKMNPLIIGGVVYFVLLVFVAKKVSWE